jgi:type I restriction enzyme S subunit
MIRVRVNREVALASYIRTVWDSDLVRRQIEQLARTTAGIYKINQAIMRGYVIPLPPLGEQRRIIAEVERRLSVVDELEAIVDANLKRAERLRQATLKRAFEGKLVPQDPADEPASVLLERIRAERAAAEATNGRARRVRRAAARSRRPMKTGDEEAGAC